MFYQKKIKGLIMRCEIHIPFMFLFFLIFCAFNLSANEEKKEREPLMPYAFNERCFLVITSFNDSTKNPHYEYLGSQISDKLINEIFQHNRFRLIERNRINAIIDELNFQQSDYLDNEFTARLGNQLGAELMLIGSINELSTTTKKRSLGIVSKKDVMISVSIEARLVIIKTGEIISISKCGGKDMVSKKRALIAVKDDRSQTGIIIENIIDEGIKTIAYEISRDAPKKSDLNRQAALP